ncbi:MAG: zinc ABC transporter substrate-binding protein [Candidatus Omnitrophica bacterium]|nr:zinc ABC transporter substrate-binding protein [Candidatus Omnitrophota bacterium]
MFHKIRTLFLLGVLSITLTSPLHAEAKLQIVATTTTFADLARQIGRDKVNVKSIASPKFNIHFIQPRPSDVRNTARADLFIFTGLDLEAWVDPLLEAAGKADLFRGGPRNVDLSLGIRLLKVPRGNLSRASGDIHVFGNPHYAMNPENIRIVAGTLLLKLKEIDSANAHDYEANARDFISRLDQKIAGWKALSDPIRGKEVISYHDDFEYMADFLGIKAEQFLEPKPGIPPTPKHLQFLERYGKENHIRAIAMPTYYPKGPVEALAKRIDAKVVMIAQHIGELPGTDDILSFFDYNFSQMTEALR